MMKHCEKYGYYIIKIMANYMKSEYLWQLEYKKKSKACNDMTKNLIGIRSCKEK